MYQQWGPPPPPYPGPAWGRPTGPSVGWAVALWVVAAGFLTVTVLCAIMAVLGFTLDNQIDNNGVTTTATVVDVGDVNITVEYTTENNELVTTDFTWWPEVYPEVDDQIEITYIRDDPYYAIQAGSNEDQIMASVFAGIGVLALAAVVGSGIGAVLVHRARGKAARAAPSPGYYY